jgi:class 3 adenylate cyclase/TolB-like protein/tetratricopeptide (TPR) repeat protein
MAREQRRLAAIVSADVAGYSRLMGQDESRTLATLKAHQHELIDPKIAEFAGRLVKTTGDGLLIEFPSVVDAVRCAVDVQRGMAERNAGVATDQRISFRIGINVGDIIIDGDDIYGDGVNVAARLQALAEPGEICVSKVVRDQVLDKLSFTFEDLGAQKVKNIARPVEAYRVDLGHEALPTAASGRRRWQRLIRSRGWRWAAVGVVAIGLAGIALWRLSPFWKASPAPTPPTLSVAVMPLAAPRDDVDASRFGETLTRNLVTRLGQIGGTSGRLRVVPAIAAATRGDSATDIREMGRSLDVRYVLHGDVLHGGDGYTVNLGLIESATGGQVWSERDTLKDSDVAIESSTNLHNLTARVRLGVVSAETRRVLVQSVSALSARDLALRAVATLNRDPTVAGVKQARKLVDEALRLEPELEPALTIGATVVDFENDVDPKPDHDRIVREMDDFTARAISLDPSDPFAWHTRGIALVYLGRWDAALEASAKRIRLDPYDPSSYVARAWILNMMGRPDEALKFIDQALAMNPFDMAYALRIACEVYLFSGQAEQAIATCEKASGTSTYWFIYVVLAAAYANNGDIEKARAAKAEILRVVPDYTIAQLRAKRYSDHPEYQQRAEKYWYGGLRKAGIPEQ